DCFEHSFLVGPLEDREHGPEDLFVSDAHRRFYVDEHGRLDEKSCPECWIGGRTSSTEHARALFAAEVDVVEHALVLRAARQRAHGRGHVGGKTGLERAATLLE